MDENRTAFPTRTVTITIDKYNELIESKTLLEVLVRSLSAEENEVSGDTSKEGITNA